MRGLDATTRSLVSRLVDGAQSIRDDYFDELVGPEPVPLPRRQAAWLRLTAWHMESCPVTGHLRPEILVNWEGQRTPLADVLQVMSLLARRAAHLLFERGRAQ
jgi:hypothetical protein